MKNNEDLTTRPSTIAPPALMVPSVNQSENSETRKDPDFDDGIFKQEISPELIGSHRKHLRTKKTQVDGMFSVKTANCWMKEAEKKPIQKMLFSELWHEGEICILFASTNLGKSILAVQIGDSISKGAPIRGFKLEAPAQKVLYFDFELSDKQFWKRYSDQYTSSNEFPFIFSKKYEFSDNFLRAEIDPDKSIPPDSDISNEDYLNKSLERAIKEFDARIIIVDNLTYMNDGTEKAREALRLMKHLKALKLKHDLSILALAHTPKRDDCKPIKITDLQGSSSLGNFCDSSFSIGRSNSDTQNRYLKQVKARNTEIIFDDENVCVCKIEKVQSFLGFGLLELDTERAHLRELTADDHDVRNMQALEMKRQGSTNKEIGDHFGVSEGAIRKRIKKAEDMPVPIPVDKQPCESDDSLFGNSKSDSGTCLSES